MYIILVNGNRIEISDKNVEKQILHIILGATDNIVTNDSPPIRKKRTKKSRPNKYTVWTPEKDQTIIGLRARGITLTEIGLRLNLSGAAISSRLDRLKQQGRYNPATAKLQTISDSPLERVSKVNALSDIDKLIS